jgi:N-acetylneuraminate epimerase
MKGVPHAKGARLKWLLKIISAWPLISRSPSPRPSPAGRGRTAFSLVHSERIRRHLTLADYPPLPAGEGERAPARRVRKLPLAITLFLLTPLFSLHAATPLEWKKLAPLPSSLGVAGAFAGVSGGALIVAGGANFPDKMPWDGGAKVWHDEVFVLEKPDGKWRGAGQLPMPLGYGVSISHPRGVICVGGSDARQHHASSFILRWSKGQLDIEPLPDLPRPCANLTGALIGNTLYVAAGTRTPTATHALNEFLSLDLTAKQPRWQTQEPWPGSARMLATAGAHDGSFYLFGGAALKPDVDGKPVREWPRDAWRYTPGQGWKRLADLPRVTVAAPSPAPLVGGRLLILGGGDGAQTNTPSTQHRGFRRDVLAYDPKTDRWEQFDETPFAHVTTSVVQWKGRVVIPSGEIRPGVRSPEVWSAPIK